MQRKYYYFPMYDTEYGRKREGKESERVVLSDLSDEGRLLLVLVLEACTDST